MTAGCMLSKMASAGRNDGHVLPEHHLRGARCTAVRESGLGPLAGPPALSTQWTLAEYLDNTGITNTFPPHWAGGGGGGPRHPLIVADVMTLRMFRRISVRL